MSRVGRQPINIPEGVTINVNNRLYLLGGFNLYTGNVLRATTNSAVFDPATNTWTESAGMPTARVGMAACNMDGKIYAIGGFNYPVMYATSEMYDPASDTWTEKTPMLKTRQMFFLGTVGERIYAIGGSYPNPQNPANPVILSSVEVYPTSLEITGMGESWQNTRMPGNITLSQNYPNPFYQYTTITFSTQIRQRIEIRVYNLLGMQIAELTNEVKPPGEYTLTFHPENLTEGIYLIHLVAEKNIQTIKCILLSHN